MKIMALKQMTPTTYESVLKEILEELYSIDCQFSMCPGPDKPFKDMAMCRRCYLIQRIRNILELSK